jgi:hypothetical protein
MSAQNAARANIPVGVCSESQDLWPFSIKENGTAQDHPLHSNRKFALK